MDTLAEAQPDLLTPLSEIVVEDEATTINDSPSKMSDDKPFFGYIYKIEFPNGKHYIGLTISIEKRTRQHINCAKNNDTKLLYKAIRKYDMIDTLELVVIDTATTQEELCKKEIEYIQIYNSHYIDGFGYNMTFGGEGSNGHIHTEETRQKISEIMKKRYGNPLAIQKNSAALKQYYIDTPEARIKNSEAQKKYNREHPEARRERSNQKTKYYQDHPEVSEKQSERMKKWCIEHPDAIERYRILGNERWESKEKRQQMSEKKKQYYRENESARREVQDAKGNNKPFDVFTKDGTFIGTFTYQFEAREYLQKEYDISSHIMVGSVLSGKQKQTRGFVFKYKTV